MKKSEKKRVIALWYVHCEATCPECYHDNNMLEDMSESGIQAGENKKCDINVECEKCGTKFIVNHVQH